MKLNSQLVLKSFRRHEVKILSEFLFKIKKGVFKLVASKLILVKLKLLLKISLCLIDNCSSNVNFSTNIDKLVINNNYYYYSRSFNLIHDTINYFLGINRTNYYLLYNLLYNYIVISKALEFVGGLSIKSFGHLPNSRKHITVLRSPHTDKKSREQFTLETYKKCMNDEFNITINTLCSGYSFNGKSCLVRYRKMETIF